MYKSNELTTARLRAVFLPDEHELHERFQLIFLKEKAISDRLTRVLGNQNWSFELLGQPMILQYEPDGSKPSVVQQARLTLRFTDADTGAVTESRYENVGGDFLLSLGKTLNEQLMNTIKGATTDAFKRVARSGGVGIYLTEMSKYKGVDINNIGTSFLPDFGYIPTVTAARTKFMIDTGYVKDSPDAAKQAEERKTWVKYCGFDDYDFQTILPFIVSLYKETHP